MAGCGLQGQRQLLPVGDLVQRGPAGRRRDLRWPGYAEAFGTSSLALNTWTHLATTYDGATVRLFVNGTQVSSVAKTGVIATSANPLEIGGDSIYGQYFAGRIDEVRVYNTALTATEIQTDMNTPVGGGGPPEDTQPPTVAITAPTAGSTASHVTTLTASASDNIAVLGVEFFVDGVHVGTGHDVAVQRGLEHDGHEQRKPYPHGGRARRPESDNFFARSPSQ